MERLPSKLKSACVDFGDKLKSIFTEFGDELHRLQEESADRIESIGDGVYEGVDGAQGLADEYHYELGRRLEIQKAESNEQILELQRKHDKQIKELSTRLQAVEHRRYKIVDDTIRGQETSRSPSADASLAHHETSQIHRQPQKDKPRRARSWGGLQTASGSVDRGTPAEFQTKNKVSFFGISSDEEDLFVDDGPPAKRRRSSGKRRHISQNDGSSDNLAQEHEKSDSRTLSPDGGRTADGHSLDFDMGDTIKLARSFRYPASSPDMTLARNAVGTLYINNNASTNQSNIEGVSALDSLDVLQSSSDEQLSTSDQKTVQRNDGTSMNPISIQSPTTVAVVEASSIAFDRGANERLRRPSGILKTRKALSNEDGLP